jgi:hypothetical protein
MHRSKRLVVAVMLTCSGVAIADRAAEPPPPPPAASRAAPRGEPKPAPEDPGNPLGEPAAGAPAQMPRRRPPPPPPPAVPAPAPEIAKLGKLLAGTYKCKGVTMRGDGSSTPIQATITIKLDLDNAWIQTSLVEDGKTTGALKWTEYRTFDPIAKQWTRIQLASSSGHVVATSLGEKDGKWTWDGTAVSPNGSLQTRDYEQRDAKQTKVWGEAMLSGSWQKLYEATCKK